MDHRRLFHESSVHSGSRPGDGRGVGREESVVNLWPGLGLSQSWVWHAR